MSGTKEELEAELATAEGWLREIGERRDDLLQKLGRPVGAGAFAQHEDEVERIARTFEAMTPAERMALYHNDPDQHRQMLDAVERQGLRRLLGGAARW